MIPGRACALLLAAGASLLQPAPASAAEKPPVPPRLAVSDEELYKSAMECKVRVEALVPGARKARDRKAVERALNYFTAQEQAFGAKLGKSHGDMVKDEIFFGLEEGARPGALVQANLCLRLAAAAAIYR